MSRSAISLAKTSLLALAVAGFCCALSPQASAADLSKETRKQLADLRAATAPFHEITIAEGAGWSESLTPCMEIPGVGGMGYHYANMDLLIDGVIDYLYPEVMVYEPQDDGSLRLVAVEYLKPGAPDETPPQALGQNFHYNPAIGAWVLHAWIWRNNPSGLFEDWNPKVSCQYAPI